MERKLGNFVRERRLELGLSQEALAERVGDSVRQAEISRIENDRVHLPRRERMAALAEALEVTLGDLMVKSGWMTDIQAAMMPSIERDHTYPDLDASDEPLALAVESVIAARKLMDESAKRLEEAVQALTLAMQSKHDDETATPDSSVEVRESRKPSSK